MIIDDFKIPLELKKNIIQPGDVDKIFSNIHILLETQKSIITLLRSVLPTHPHIVGLGDKWCEVAPFFEKLWSLRRKLSPLHNNFISTHEHKFKI